MPDCWKKQFSVAAMAAAIIGLAACAAVTTPPPQETPQSRLREAVQTLLANQAAGVTTTLTGTGFVKGPIVVPLADGEIVLVPLTPDLDRVLAGLQRQWLEGKRRPLPIDTYKTALTVLTAHRMAVVEAGGETLIRFTRTDGKGKFRFEGVPEGSWLVLADLRSSVSILLWAYPVRVRAGQDMLPVLLGDGNVLLEAQVESGTTPQPATGQDAQPTSTGDGKLSSP